MKRILLCTDGSLFSQNCYRYAAWLATRLRAKVTAIYVTDARGKAAAEARNFSGSIGLGASEALLDRLVALESQKAKLDRERANLILEEARSILADNGVDAIDLIHETGFLVDCLHQFEADADLIVLGKRGENAAFASGHLGTNLERIVRSTHKPCLVTSRQFKPIERLLLAYDGSPSCQKILQFLADSPAFQGLELHILTVGKNEVDDLASTPLEFAQQQAIQAGFQPICSLVAGHPETAIASYISSNTIDLLLMGAYGHNRIRYLVIGSTTTQILRSSNIPVLLFR